MEETEMTTEEMEMVTKEPEMLTKETEMDVDGTAEVNEVEKDGYESDSESESESDSDADDSVEEARAETLEKTLAENPFDYDSHVQYIHCLRKLGHIEKLRKARESMHERFPLTSQMWREWAKDETSVLEGSGAFAEVEKIYELGIKEYMSVSLWCEYIEFLQEHDPTIAQCTPAGLLKMRDIFERALTAAGLHVTEGNKIWELYREFEQAILLTMDENRVEERAKQIQRIRSLFHRQLSVPLAVLKSTLSSYKQWETEQGNVCDTNSSEVDGIPPNVVSAYQKALEMYNARAFYEDQLSNTASSDTDKLQHYLNYIKFEETSGDPARVQILYERAISEFPISSDLWLGYTGYLDRTLKVGGVLKDVYSRSTRNCPWVGDLWIHYLLSLERTHASEEELSAVFERSITNSFSSFKEYLELYLTRIDGLRRRISSHGSKEDALDYALIPQTFQRAVEYLSETIGTNDLLHLYAYWTRLEAKLGKDMVAARGVWENLVKKSGSMLEFWEGYIAMEVELGNINEARSIYKRCYSKRFSGNGSEDVCHYWLRFEREYGTLDDYDLAVKKVTPRLQDLAIFRMQQDAPSSVQNDNAAAKNTPQKRKTNKTSTDKQRPSKRARNSEPTSSRKRTDAAIVDQAVFAPVPKTNDVTKEQAAQETKAKDSKRNLYTDQCTAFVSNLNLQANEQHLHKFFSDSGGVTAIRLLRDKFTGRSRGLAYVDFTDEDHLASAISKNRQMLLGQKVSIARSDPKHNQKRESAGNSNRGRGRGGDISNKEKVPDTGISASRGNNVKLFGKNTFAAPRAVARPLGWSKKETTIETSTEQPKSNDEFREMLLKK